MSSGKVLLGVLTGIAAGALAGVLLAPDKGSATRKRILRKGNDYGDDFKDKFHDFLESMKEDITVAKGKVKEYSENGNMKAEREKVK